MNIYEACLEAENNNKQITRRIDGSVYFKINPTNSDNRLCEIMMSDGSNKKKGWQPKLEDLIATDWEVV